MVQTSEVPVGSAQVVQAIATQLATLNTNSRYLHSGMCTYAEELTVTFPDPLSVSAVPVPSDWWDFRAHLSY